MKKNAKRYNCSIIDLYDKSVLATLNSKRIDAELAIQTLQIALDRNPVKGKIILHSDQGSQYTSRAFTEFCEGKGIRQSMSKAGCPYDNSPMESFYGTFKSEFIRQNRFETDQELNERTLDYVYGYYNHIRPHSSNGYMTPFEKRYWEYPKVCVNLQTGVRYNYSVWRFLLWQEEKVTHHRKQQCAK